MWYLTSYCLVASFINVDFCMSGQLGGKRKENADLLLFSAPCWVGQHSLQEVLVAHTFVVHHPAFETTQEKTKPPGADCVMLASFLVVSAAAWLQDHQKA